MEAIKYDQPSDMAKQPLQGPGLEKITDPDTQPGLVHARNLAVMALRGFVPKSPNYDEQGNIIPDTLPNDFRPPSNQGAVRRRGAWKSTKGPYGTWNRGDATPRTHDYGKGQADA